MRDYKKEYARRKARAKELGYASPREATRARREKEKFVSSAELKQIRAESLEWSRRHSKAPRSKFKPTMSNQQAAAYHAAFVARPKGRTGKERHQNKQKALHDYLALWYQLDDKEWKQLYA